MAFAWKFPLLFRFWNSGTYTGMSIPKFSSNILRGDYENTLELEIRGLQKRRLIEANWQFRLILYIFQSCFWSDIKLRWSCGLIWRAVHDFLICNVWKLEKEPSVTGKRISLRKVPKQFSSFQNIDIDFATHHSMDVSTEVCSNEGRMSSFSCATCVKFVHRTRQIHLQFRDIGLSNIVPNAL